MMRQIGAAASSFALLQQATPGPEAPGQNYSFFIMMGLVFLIIYFLMIRPESKRRKAVQAMLDNLKNGDKVITSGGIHGIVAGITDDIVQLKITTNVKIDVSRSAIASLQKDQGE